MSTKGCKAGWSGAGHEVIARKSGGCLSCGNGRKIANLDGSIGAQFGLDPTVRFPSIPNRLALTNQRRAIEWCLRPLVRRPLSGLANTFCHQPRFFPPTGNHKHDRQQPDSRIRNAWGNRNDGARLCHPAAVWWSQAAHTDAEHRPQCQRVQTRDERIDR